MNNDLAFWLGMIEKSFLPATKKTSLRDLVEQEGLSQNFLHLFDTWLAEELEARKKEYLKDSQLIDQGHAALIKKYAQEKEKLETELKASLASLDPSDAVSEQAAWKNFYEKVDALQSQCEKEMLSLGEKTFKAHVN